MSQEQPEKLGRYQITGFLGKGAMGIVYEGRDPNIGRRVAIKTARRDVLETGGHADEMMERFLREARAAGALNHPNIVTVYDANEEDGTAYIAMEFIEGSDLQNSIDERRRYTPEEVADLCATICDALHHAHEHGVVHRDVKPANIMLLPDGTLRVTDFGIARMADSTLTIDGAMIGTPHYMSPEQFMGHRVDGRSDLFSVGVIAYVLLTGERPFPGDALATVMHAVTHVSPIAPRELNFSISPTLSAVVLKALSKDPNQRYKTAAAMAAALRESVKDAPNPAVTMVDSPTDSMADTLAGAMLDTQSIDDDATIATPPPAKAPRLAPSEPAPVTTKPPDNRNKRWALYAAAAVLAVLAMVGVALLVDGRDGGSAATTSEWDGYSVGPDDPHYSRLLVHAFEAPNEQYYLEKEQGRALSDADVAQLKAAEAEVFVIYPDGSGEEHRLGRLTGSALNTPELPLHGRPASFELILRKDGFYETKESVVAPREAGDIAEYAVGAGGSNWPFLLCPKPEDSGS